MGQQDELWSKNLNYYFVNLEALADQETEQSTGQFTNLFNTEEVQTISAADSPKITDF